MVAELRLKKQQHQLYKQQKLQQKHQQQELKQQHQQQELKGQHQQQGRQRPVPRGGHHARTVVTDEVCQPA